MTNSIYLEIQKHVKEIEDIIQDSSAEHARNVYDEGYQEGEISAYNDTLNRLRDLLQVAAGIYEESESRDIQEQ